MNRGARSGGKGELFEKEEREPNSGGKREYQKSPKSTASLLNWCFPNHAALLEKDWERSEKGASGRVGSTVIGEGGPTMRVHPGRQYRPIRRDVKEGGGPYSGRKKLLRAGVIKSGRTALHINQGGSREKEFYE